MFSGPAASLIKGSVSARLIVTPNVDHLRLLNMSRAFRRAYLSADVVVNDSRVLEKIAFGDRALCLPGSELAPLKLRSLPPGSRVTVVGCADEVRRYLTDTLPALKIDTLNPSMGYVYRRAERRRIAEAVVETKPHLTLICTGAPQSELFAAQLKRAGIQGDVLCCGSALLFMAGAKVRAPALIRSFTAEWVWRFTHEPATRRRYAADLYFVARHLTQLLRVRLTGDGRVGRIILRCAAP
jgi:N-acetylglucosaminyldiphosphoundecaprenol N-acetyl-beta-D-mannosaminyltransferase